MARGNISTYDAAREVLRPDEQGFAAFEQMGRRVSGIYNQTAQDYKEIGRLQAQEIEGRKWPFDILALQQANSAFSVRLGSDRNRGGGGRAAHDDLGRMAAGMSALGGYLGATASNAGGGKLIDVTGNQTYIGRTAKPGTTDGLWSNPGDTLAQTAGTGVGAGTGDIYPGDIGDTTGGRDTTVVPGRTFDPTTGQFTDPTHIFSTPAATPWDSSIVYGGGGRGFFGGLWDSLSGAFSGGSYDQAPTDTSGYE